MPRPKPEEEVVKFQLRCPVSLHTKLRKRADAMERSLHWYIINVLREHVNKKGR